MMQEASAMGVWGNVRGFLADCRFAAMEIESLRRQLEAVYVPNAPRFCSSSVVALRSHDNNPVVTALNTMDHYDALLARKIAALEQQLVMLEEMIYALGDGKTRAVARYYYGQAWTDARIAEALEMDERSIRRKRVTLVKQLERRFG